MTRRWQDWVNLVLGVWLFVSPWTFGYTDNPVYAAMNAYATGAAIVVFAAVAVYMPKVWEEWVNMALGIWLIVSPMALNFTSHMASTMNAVILGILVAVFTASAMSLDKTVDKWWQDHHFV